MATQKAPELKLTPEQEKEGYWVEQSGNNVLVWHKNTHIGLLSYSPNIQRKIREVVEKRRKELNEVEKKTGWKPE